MEHLKIMVVTTSRADYGLLYPLLKQLTQDEYFDLSLVATGTHLSALHGKTIDVIQRDGFTVTAAIEMVMQSDSEHALCSSISLGLIEFSRVCREIQPNCIVVLGDRYELWSIGMAAVIHKIPLIHIHGGEGTFGVFDDPIRHSITKMASLHFPSIELYGKRIVQMGEEPERVHVVGAMGIDNIKNITLMTQEDLSEYAGVDFSREVALLTYHPVTLDDYTLAGKQMEEVLTALMQTELFTLITMPNADTGGTTIYDVIQHYANTAPGRFKLVKSLGQRGYLSAMKYAKVMVGNSSSGIIESASFQLPVVNIGDRQAGRFKPANIIDCVCSADAILGAIKEAISPKFRESLLGLENPYGDGKTAERIARIVKSVNFADKEKLLKKGFFDLDFTKIDLRFGGGGRV